MNLVKRHRHFLFRFLTVAISCLFITDNAIAQRYDSSFIVAKVNDKVITNLELQDRYKFVLFSSKMKVSSLQDKKSLLNQIIDKMVDEELIRQDAEKLKITNSPQELKDAIELIALRQKKTPVQYRIALMKKNISTKNYNKQVDAELLWSKIISQVLRSQVKITEAEIKEFFEQQKFNIDVKKLHIAQIFIPKNKVSSTHAAIMARKIVSELRAGADFVEMVKHFSRDSFSADNDGEIGWVSQKDIDKRIYQGVSKLKKGDYSDPVLLSDGYYIFKLLDSRVETKIEDQDLEAARKSIFMKKLQNLSKGYLMELRKNAFIEVDRDTLTR